MFLQIHCSPDVSHSTVWESLKTYLRGTQMISYTAYDNKHRTKGLWEPSELILDVDNRDASSTSPDLYRERLLHQSESDNLEQLRLKSKADIL